MKNAVGFELFHASADKVVTKGPKLANSDLWELGDDMKALNAFALFDKKWKKRSEKK